MRYFPAHIVLITLMLLLAGHVLTGRPGSASAQTDTPDTSAGQSTPVRLTPNGFGTSYWGEIPPATDSVTTVFDNRRTPGWQKALYLPVRVVLLPLWLLDRGTSAVVNTAFRDPLREAAAFLAISGPWGSYFQPSIEAGGLSGFGLGIGLRHDNFFGDDNKARLDIATTVNGDTKLTAGAEFVGKSNRSLSMGAGVRLRPNARFFGIGPNSQEANESFYKQEVTWIGARYRRDFGSSWFFEADGIFSSTLATTTDPNDLPDDKLLIEDVFPINLIPGFGSKASGADVSLALGISTTASEGRPSSGGTYRIKSQYYSDFDPNDIKFWNFRGDAQQFIGLWNSKQVLALRGFGAWIENTGSDPIPFQRLLVNDFPDQFRGFKDFRWRDRGILGLNVEYRWPIWVAEKIDGAGADFYLLGDFGQVFGDLDQIKWDNLTVSYGFGARFVVTPAFQGRIELAFSNEETVFLLEGVQLFQAFEGIFLRGQEPVPSR